MTMHALYVIVKQKSLEHLFISCATHVDAWLFVENMIRRCTKNATFTLSDRMRIQGLSVKDPLCLPFIARLNRTIWNVRCKVLCGGKTSNANALSTYKTSLRRHVVLEKQRLEKNLFRGTTPGTRHFVT